MAEENITFGKIVSFPKPSSWSQTYNAGKLFAVLSLKSIELKEQDDPDFLSRAGRDVLDKLEEEFFTIEAKSPSSVKQAVTIALQKIPEETTPSFAAAIFNNNVLYLFAVGGAEIFIKRNGKFGTILDSGNLDPKSMTSSSGPLQNNDLITLATKSFLDVIDPSLLSSSLENHSPEEIAASLTPKVHEKEEGTAAAFFIKYARQDKTPQESSYKEQTKKAEDKMETPFPVKNHIPVKFSHSKKVYLTVAAIILIILASSVFFAVKKQDDNKTQVLFENVYESALKKYEEGDSLLDLNANLAKESLIASRELLEDNKDKFKEDSKEQEQILTLLEKVNDGLEKLDKDISYFLKTQLNPPTGEPTASFFTQDENYVYILDDSGVHSLDKKTGQNKMLIKNDSWKTPDGIGTYLGNIYILDKSSNQILKFVDEGEGFAKTNYFSDSPPNLSNAISLTIDGSIWILFKDGSIQKFIKGTKDVLNVSGFKKPLENPTKIFTNKDTDNLYILDNGNSRVVVIGKDGKYRSEYQLDAIKNAKDFEVVEGSKKIYILSQNKIHEIGMK